MIKKTITIVSLAIATSVLLVGCKTGAGFIPHDKQKQTQTDEITPTPELQDIMTEEEYDRMLEDQYIGLENDEESLDQMPEGTFVVVEDKYLLAEDHFYDSPGLRSIPKELSEWIRLNGYPCDNIIYHAVINPDSFDHREGKTYFEFYFREIDGIKLCCYYGLGSGKFTIRKR